MGESLAQQLKAKKENDIRSVKNRLNILSLLVSCFCGVRSLLKLRFDSSLIDDGPCRFDFPLVELVEHVLRKGYLAPINLKAEETSLGRAVKSQAARDVRRLADQEVNVEMKVRDFTKIPLQHFAITRQPDRFAVVVHFVMNELFQLSPILPVETVDIFAVDGGKTGVSQSTCRSSLIKNREQLTRKGLVPAIKTRLLGSSTCRPY
jgi:hypothetical protein